VHNLVVDRDGKVFIPNIGSVYVYGLSFTQAQKLLQDKFSKVYNDFKMNVTLGKLRTIKVFVVGEASQPGVYCLSSLSTVFNALYASGGPGIEGSMRNIKLIRENKEIAVIDLYKFLLEGDKSQDQRLCAGDTIFIPLRGPLVGVAGEVVRPALYELKGSTTVTELIGLAGGVKPTGYLHRIQIERLKHHEGNTVEDISMDLFSGEKDRMATGVFDGDFVLVFPIPEQAYKYVELVGMVLRPGRYELKEGMKIGDLLDLGKLLEEACVEKIDVIRTYKDKHQQVISINLNKQDKACDLKLQEWDRVVVYSSWDLKPRDRVSITGLVKNPGSYDLLEDMTVGDIICQAGGITKADEIIHVEIIRTTVSGQVEVIAVNINDVLGGDRDRDTKLQQFDHIYVYAVFEPEITPVIKITGQVKKPGVYSFSKETRVSDIIARSGGLEKGAALLNGEISRMIKNESGVSFIHMPVNLKKILLENDANEDIVLQEDDSLFIRQIPEWREEDTVVVSGEVLFPGTYAITKNERLSSVLERAGGFSENAFLPGSIFIRQSVKKQQECVKNDFLSTGEEALLREEAGLLGEKLLPEELIKRQQVLSNKKELLRLSMDKVLKGRIALKLARLERLKNSRD
ncbi:MAG: SLBB domain-containing protein, partial [Candidatus Desantisbacteria bacterium]